MIDWERKHPQARIEMLGMIPAFISELNPAPAREQFDHNYRHGGGWNPLPGFKMSASGNSISYPGDPPMPLLFEAKLREETIRVYECAWVAIVQADGSYEICRMA